MDNSFTVTLVHGTYSPHAAWTRDDSPFVADLRAAFGQQVEITRVCWSGRNTFFDRFAAAEKLNAHIAGLGNTRPHFVIGHSHGGSIALYAQLADSVRGIACLSTPFLHTKIRDPKYRSPLLVVEAVVAMFMTPLFVICTTLRTTWQTTAIAATVVLVPSLILAAIINHVLKTLTDVATRFAAVAMDRTNEPDNLLIVRVAGDEASMGLTSWQALLYLTHTLFSRAADAYERSRKQWLPRLRLSRRPRTW